MDFEMGWFSSEPSLEAAGLVSSDFCAFSSAGWDSPEGLSKSRYMTKAPSAMARTKKAISLKARSTREEYQNGVRRPKCEVRSPGTDRRSSVDCTGTSYFALDWSSNSALRSSSQKRGIPP